MRPRRTKARRRAHDQPARQGRPAIGAARPPGRARQAWRWSAWRDPRLRRPRPLGRSRLPAGRDRAGDHLDGFPVAKPDLPGPRQSRQPAVRLFDGRRHCARHRMRSHGRRDRPFGRLGQRVRVRIGRRPVGQQRLAGSRGGACRPRRRRGDRPALRGFIQPLRHAELRLDACGPAGGPRHAALYPRFHGLDKPALRFRLGAFRPDHGHAGFRFLWLCRAGGDHHLRNGIPHSPAPHGCGPVVPVARRPRASGGGDYGRARSRRSLPEPGARRAVDVRPVRRSGHRHELCPEAHQVGPFDDSRRRQPRGGAPRRHQCALHLHQRLRGLFGAGGGRRGACRRAARFRQPAGRHRRREPQRHRGGGDRRH